MVFQYFLGFGKWIPKAWRLGICFAMAPLAVPESRASAVDGGLDEVTLQLKWRHQFQSAGYYAALEEGYYREAGLDVHIVEPAPGEEPARAVIEGRAEFGVATSDLVLMRARGEPVVVLAPIFQHSPLILVASKNSGVERVHDLVGRPVAIEPHADELFAYLGREGIQRDEMDLRSHAFDPDLLIDGTVAATSAYSTDEPFLLDQAGVDYLTFDPRAGGIDFYGDTLFTTEEQIRRHPERVAAFREASLRGWEYAMEHPEEVVDLILSDYSRRHSREHLLFEAEHSRRLIIPDRLEIGDSNPGRWRHIAEVYASLGMIPPTANLEGLLYESNPATGRSRFHVVVLSGMAALVVLAWAAFYYRRLNRRLRTEIEERRRLAVALESRTREQQLVLEHAHVGIAYVRNRKIVWGNRTMAEMFGCSVEELAGMSTRSFYMAESDYERVGNQYVDVLGRDIRLDLELPMERKGGERRIIHLIGRAIDPAKPHDGAIFVLHDITEKKRIEAELRAAKENAEHATRTKSEFLAHASHEIRTPLNGIIGVIDLLQEMELTDEQREHCELVGASADSLLALLNDLLDASRIEAGKLQIEHQVFELSDMLDRVCRLFKPRALQSGVELRVVVKPGTPECFVGDAHRISQVLSNLLSNALKFTREGHIEIAVDGELEEGIAGLRIRVTDTGMGIPADRLERIFERYEQGDNAITRTYGGSGLGLTISRDLVLLMGGKLTVDSAEGAGATFELRLPLKIHSSHHRAP